MKKRFPWRSFWACITSAGCAVLVSGCSTNMLSKGVGGAAAGATSASLLGAVTDLVIDGEVNTSRLQRNLVSGALAGGTAGAVVGHQQDQQQAAQQKTPAAKPAPTPPRMDVKKLTKEIGSDNVEALNDLFNYRYQDAYAWTLKSTKSKKTPYQAAGYAIQALIDLDRGNTEGVAESLAELVKVSDEVNSLDEARKGLNDLSSELKDERRVQGIRKP